VTWVLIWTNAWTKLGRPEQGTPAVEITISQAKAHLADLVRRAEAGDEIVLTRHGQPVARIAPVSHARARSPAERRALLERLRTAAADKVTKGPDAARSQDLLYDEFGLPK
jgi:prevent-host-death family protein